jgi:hypothetical protein
MKSFFSACRLVIRHPFGGAAMVFALVMGAGMSVAAAALLDPTQPYGSGGQGAPRASGLQSTIIGVNERRAVIDGQVYREGDRYGAATIMEIRSYEVILSEAGKLKRLRMVPPLVQHQSNGQEN